MAGLYLNHVKVAEESGGVVSLPNTVQFNNLKIGETEVINSNRQIQNITGLKIGETEVINSNRQIQNITGIDFGSSSGTGTPSSNLLDDYEEGTWTPVSGAGTLIIADTPTYTKTGRHVFLTAVFTMPTQTNTDQARVYGLPFTPKNNGSNSEYGAGLGEHNYGSYITLCIDSGSSIILFRPNGSSSTTYTNVSGKNFRFSISYLTDS